MITRWIVVLLSVFQSRFYLSNRAINVFFKFLIVLLQFLGKFSTKLIDLAALLPRSTNQIKGSFLGLSDSFKRKIVCDKCHALYNFDECIQKTGLQRSIERCRNRSFKKKCNTLLMKEIVSRTGHSKFYPHKIFCFSSLIVCLQAHVLRTGFVELCESTRNNISTEALLTDVYDGLIWNQFLTVENTPFLSQRNNYGLLLNVDWFQPYKHVQYSVGVIYLVILNLPRSIRFKRENVILFGIIPGPREPSLTINSFLSPLVADLLQLWDGVVLKISDSVNAVFKCALLGVACDLPAARKTCGFLSHSANLGCSRCYQKFSRGFGLRSCYGNFERDVWLLRTNTKHRSDVKKTLQCTSKTEKTKKEAELGCRYTSLLDLPYFLPIQMLLIDPMHNLFLGTAKHVARDLWVGKSILSSSAIRLIENRLKKVIVPVGLGRIPVSINSGIFLTAEQWKNWTIYFSIYCLADILPKVQLENWRHFVLACRRLCQYSISIDDVTIADGLLLKFCRRFVQIYGIDSVTPNMHMH